MFQENPPLQSEYHYAGFAIRFAAFLLDSLFLCFIIFPILIYAYGIDYFLPQQFVNLLLQNKLFRGPLDLFLQLILPAIAFIIFWIYRAATPGKMMLKIKIIATDGSAPNTKQCIIRYLSYYLSLIPFGLGFIWIEINPKKQAWHDLIAKTYVIYSK